MGSPVCVYIVMYKISKPAGDSPWRVLMRNHLLYVFTVRVLGAHVCLVDGASSLGRGTFPILALTQGEALTAPQGQRHRRRPRPPSETQVGVLERRGTEVLLLPLEVRARPSPALWAWLCPQPSLPHVPGLACRLFPVHASQAGLPVLLLGHALFHRGGTKGRHQEES